MKCDCSPITKCSPSAHNWWCKEFGAPSKKNSAELGTVQWYWEIFEKHGIKKSFGFVKGPGHIVFKLPYIPIFMRQELEEGRPMGQLIEYEEMKWWKRMTTNRHVFIKSKLGRL